MKEVTFLVQSKRDDKLAVDCSTVETILASGRLNSHFSFLPYFIWGINLQHMLNKVYIMHIRIIIVKRIFEQ